MTWQFEKEAKRLHADRVAIRHLQRANNLNDKHTDMLLAIAACLEEEAGEVSLVLPMAELGRMAGLSIHQAKRVLTVLQEKGFIVRKQTVKRAGVEAITTLLPAGLKALGLEMPGVDAGQEPASLPTELARLLCGQPMDLVAAVVAAWNSGGAMPGEGIDLSRTNPEWQQQVVQIMNKRSTQIAFAAEEARAQVEQRTAALQQGFDLVKTTDGEVAVDVRVYEARSPGAVGWSFIKDVIDEIRWRDASLVTAATLPRLIAEAAYSRAYAPFCRGSGWKEGVWKLGGQMARPTWGRPKKIWNDWYEAAEACCGAVLHH